MNDVILKWARDIQRISSIGTGYSGFLDGFGRAHEYREALVEIYGYASAMVETIKSAKESHG